MRRLIPLVATLAALGVAVPAISATRDTKVNRHGEAVGSMVHKGGSRYVVENQNYDVLAETRRQGNRRFNFLRNDDGVQFAYVKKATGRRWDVFASGHSEPVGTVERVGKNAYRAYHGGEAVGDARGPAAVQGAAAVLVVFD